MSYTKNYKSYATEEETAKWRWFDLDGDGIVTSNDIVRSVVYASRSSFHLNANQLYLATRRALNQWFEIKHFINVIIDIKELHTRDETKQQDIFDPLKLIDHIYFDLEVRGHIPNDFKKPELDFSNPNLAATSTEYPEFFKNEVFKFFSKLLLAQESTSLLNENAQRRHDCIYLNVNQRRKWGYLDRDKDSIVTSCDIISYMAIKFPHETPFFLSYHVNKALVKWFFDEEIGDRQQPYFIDVDLSKLHIKKNSSATIRAEYYPDPFDIDALLTTIANSLLHKGSKSTDTTVITIEEPINDRLIARERRKDIDDLGTSLTTCTSVHDNYETQEDYIARIAREKKAEIRDAHIEAQLFAAEQARRQIIERGKILFSFQPESHQQTLYNEVQKGNHLNNNPDSQAVEQYLKQRINDENAQASMGYNV